MKCIFYWSHMSTVTDDRKFTKKSFLVRPETTVRRKKIKTEKKRKKKQQEERFLQRPLRDAKMQYGKVLYLRFF